MKVTPDIVRDEFIGTQGKVVFSSHNGYVGITGPIINETRNTFAIQHQGRLKNIIKEQAVFNFTFSDGTVVEIDGKLLVGRPEDRLKKSIKRLW